MTPGGLVWPVFYGACNLFNLRSCSAIVIVIVLTFKLAFLYMILSYCVNLGLLIFLLVLGLFIILYYVVIIFIWQLSIWPCLGCHWPKVKVKQMSEWLSWAVPVKVNDLT